MRSSSSDQEKQGGHTYSVNSRPKPSILVEFLPGYSESVFALLVRMKTVNDEPF